MNKFQRLLEELDLALVKYNLPNYEKLKGPLSLEQMEIILKGLKISHSDFKDLFLWKNGFDIKMVGSCQIFEFGTLLPLDVIIKTVNKNNDVPRWRRSLIPFITDATGQYILFDISNKSYGKLFFYSASIPVAVNTISFYDSIELYIQTIIEAYDQSIFTYNYGTKNLDIDFIRYFALAKKNNRESKFWDG